MLRRFLLLSIVFFNVVAIAEAVTEEERLASLINQRNILVLEEAFMESLVKHAMQPKEPGQFPAECKEIDDLFKQEAGYGKRNDLKREFNKALDELLNPVTVQEDFPGMSTTTKVLLAGAGVVGAGAVGTALFFAAPLILPAAIVAKTTAVLISLKATAAIALTKAGVAVAAKTVAVKAVAGVAVKLAPIIAFDVVQHQMKNLMLPETLEQEVERREKLKKARKPLKEQIREAYFV